MATTTETRDLYYEHVQWKPVLAIEAELAFPDNPGVAGFWSIKFHVEGSRFTLTTDDDTDEILFAVEPATTQGETDPMLHPALHEMLGRKLGWVWYARNVQGYEDALMLSLGNGLAGSGATPHFVFLVEASVIMINKVMPYKP